MSERLEALERLTITIEEASRALNDPWWREQEQQDDLLKRIRCIMPRSEEMRGISNRTDYGWRFIWLDMSFEIGPDGRAREGDGPSLLLERLLELTKDASPE